MGKMYIHMLVCVCESQRRFSSLLSLKYLYISFSFSPCSVPLLPCVPLWLSAAVCPLSSSPFVPIWRALEAPRRPSVCRSVCRAACPLLVSYQAQNAMTVWADAPRIFPRSCLLLSMCCRGLFRCFRCPFRVCVLLPCVVWW